MADATHQHSMPLDGDRQVVVTDVGENQIEIEIFHRDLPHYVVTEVDRGQGDITIFVMAPARMADHSG